MYYKLVPNLIIIKGTPCPPPPTPNPQEVLSTNLQHSYTNKWTTQPLLPTYREYQPTTYNTHTLRDHPPPTPIPQGVPPTILQQSYTKGTHHPTPPYPQPTGNTTHHLTTLIHPQSYNTHTLKGPLPPPPTPNPQQVPPTILQHSYTHNLITLTH